MKRLFTTVLVCCCLTLFGGNVMGQENNVEPRFPLESERILFLGDSITHAGQYVSWVRSQLLQKGVDPLPEFVNVGLGSETCSGLSEPGHPFPRPDVHERLDRALAKVKPDVVVACYGMNDGIYYPPSEERLRAYQDGIRRLVEKCRNANARVILMTPPPFDAVPLQGKGKLKPAGEEEYAYFAMYENYDDVLKQYSEWLKKNTENVAMVIDLHSAISQHLAEQRQSNPKFTMAPDGIHPNQAGHRILGNTILKAWGIEPLQAEEVDEELFKLTDRQMRLMHDAWLSDIKHKRPGVKPGLPLPEAKAQAEEIDGAIQELLDR